MGNIVNPSKDYHFEPLFGPAVVTTAVSTYKSVADCAKFFVYLAYGASNGTFDLELLQATSAAGAGAKPIAKHSVTAAITQLSATDDDKQALIEVNVDALDPGFTHVAASITVSGTTTAFVLLVKEPLKKPAVQPASLAQSKLVVG